MSSRSFSSGGLGGRLDVDATHLAAVVGVGLASLHHQGGGGREVVPLGEGFGAPCSSRRFCKASMRLRRLNIMPEHLALARIAVCVAVGDCRQEGVGNFGKGAFERGAVDGAPALEEMPPAPPRF